MNAVDRKSPQSLVPAQTLVMRGIWAIADVLMFTALVLSSAVAVIAVSVSTLMGRPMGRAAWVPVKVKSR